MPAPIAAARPLRVALAGDRTPADAPGLVDDDPHPFVLAGRWAGGGALAGSSPIRVAHPDEDPFVVLDAQPELTEPPPAGFVGGGWFGFLGYGLAARLEALGPPPPAPHVVPPFALAFHDHVLRRDPEGRWWFEALWTPERAAILEERLATLRARLATPAPAPRSAARDVATGARGAADAAADAQLTGPRTDAPAATADAQLAGPWTARPAAAGHARAVAACRERIAAGDLFQANLALRLSAPLHGAPAALFARGVAALAPDRAAYLAGPWGALASLSPELFLERHGDVVRSAPIKGTRPRDADPEALAASPKDRAENVMIVDLVRNDLGRVAVPGTVTVEALAEPRPHAGVWHLVSEVAARLPPGLPHRDLLAAAFPPGSVTGAPKVAALDVISALESAARQAFCGAIGFASPAAGLELSVTIRTFEARDGRVWLDVGGGVVHDSDPDAEAREALAKAAPLLAAIGAEGPPADEPAPSDAARGEATDGDATRGEPARRAAPVPLRLGPRPVPRPDPAAGIFETVLVRDGVPVALDRHLARLAASAAALGLPAPDLELPPLGAHERLRIVLDAAGTRAERAPLPAATGATHLVAVTLPGGLGAHKWRDRRLVDALQAAVAPAVPLLVDLDGRILEATRANIIVLLADGRLVTPPLDGRILPGVTRARVLETLPVQEAEVRLDSVAGAALTGALRGLEPVATLDGRPLSDRVPAAARPPAGARTT